MGTTYADAGVNLSLDQKASKIMYNAKRKTWPNRRGKIGEIRTLLEKFRGPELINIGMHPKYLAVESDGTGTKPELAERMGDYSTIAHDLLAMNVDDLARWGIEPTNFTSNLDINSLGKDDSDNYLEIIQQISEGLTNAANIANVALVSGETATLGNRVGGQGNFHMNWNGSALGICNINKVITGEKIQEGDIIISLGETGFRSNGLSLGRKVFETEYGKDWHEEKLGGETLGKLVLEPSRIYSRGIMSLLWEKEDGESLVPINGIVHNTGGGVEEKLGGVLEPTGLGAVIESSSVWGVPKVMAHCLEVGKVEDREAYRTFNMGHGMFIIVSPEYDIRPFSDLGRFNPPIGAKVVGYIAKNPGIKIKNDGFFQEKEYLEFNVE